MLAKLLEVLELQGLLSFARVWEDDDGPLYHIRHGEGGEQGDPLMPFMGVQRAGGRQKQNGLR